MNTQSDPSAKRSAKCGTLDLELDREVRRLLDLHRGGGRWATIATDTDVSYSWLSKFTRGETANPSYATLRRLYLYLVDVLPPPARQVQALVPPAALSDSPQSEPA